MPAECTGRPPETVFTGTQVRPRWSDKVGRFNEDILAVAECERTLIDEVRGDRK